MQTNDMPATSTAASCFRENVRILLEKTSTTLTALAEELNMSRPALSRVLNAHEDVSFERGEKIAAHFGLELRDLLKPVKKFKKIA